MEKIKFEEKFIVINKKRFNEMFYAAKSESDKNDTEAVENNLIEAIGEFVREYERITGNNFPDNKYLVCNQDEPYADTVKNIILQGEQQKVSNGI